MAKGRGTISASKPEDFGDGNLHVHYCICGEFILVIDSPLATLPRRPKDRSFCLVNTGPLKRTYKLNISEQNSTLKPPKPANILSSEGGTAGGGEDLLSGGGTGASGKNGNGVLALENGQFEFQRRFYCPRCQLQIGYETQPGDKKGPATFILSGAVTDVQNKVPADAFGEPSITPAGPPKGVEA